MTTESKWNGCPYNAVKHEETLKAIENGTYPDPHGHGKRYHQARLILCYEWLKEQESYKMERGLY